MLSRSAYKLQRMQITHLLATAIFAYTIPSIAATQSGPLGRAGQSEDASCPFEATDSNVESFCYQKKLLRSLEGNEEIPKKICKNWCNVNRVSIHGLYRSKGQGTRNGRGGPRWCCCGLYKCGDVFSSHSCSENQYLKEIADADDDDDNCVDDCGDGWHPDDERVCRVCRSYKDGTGEFEQDGNCKTCAGEKIDECTECKDNFYLKEKEGCVADCEKAFDGSEDFGFATVEKSDGNAAKCEACNDTDNCYKCPGDAKVCTECTNDYHLHNGECIKECPFKLKPKTCADPQTLRDISEINGDYIFRFVPSGGERNATTKILKGSKCAAVVLEDTIEPTTTLQLSPNVTHTRDSTLLLSIAFNDAGSTTVIGMKFDDVAFTPNGQAQPVDGIGRVLAKNAYLQVEFQKQGKVTIDLPADVALDESCNKNAAAKSVSVTYDIDPPTVSITSFTTHDLVDTVEITITDTLSPIKMESPESELKNFFKLTALGLNDAVPTLDFGSNPCIKATEITTVCTFEATHMASFGLVPYTFTLQSNAAADAAGNQSPSIKSPAYHCPENVPVGANGKCIKFNLVVNENKRSRSGADFTNPTNITKYIVGENYRISPWELVEDATIVSDGNFDDITYTLVDALDGWFVGTGTGEITGVFNDPSKEDPVKMTLYAVDATGQRAEVEEYTFKVVSPPKFVLKSSNARRKTGKAYTNPKEIEANNNMFYAVGHTYKISPRTVLNTTDLSSVGGSLDTLVYGLAGTLPEDLFVKTTTGDILVTFTAADEGNTYSVDLDVIDGTERATLETMTMEVKYKDVEDLKNRAAFGPNKKKCLHGALVDDPAKMFDKSYACDCSGLQFEGDNCEIPIKELLNCKPGFALIDGKCEEFKLHINDTKRVVQEGNTTVYTDPTSMSDTFYEVFKSYRVAAFEILSSTQVTAGNLSDITYTLGAGTPNNFFLSTTSGEIFWQFGKGDADKSFSITLNAVDKGGAVQPVETMVMNVRYNDVDVPKYGPHNRACSINTKEIVDLVPFDKQVTCECDLGFGGDNCDSEVCLDGKVCDDDLNICRLEKGEVIVDGNCEPCLFNSQPNDDQTECLIDECSALESDGLCTCNLVDLTNPVTGRVKLTCNGLKWSSAIYSETATFLLPPIVHELTLNAVKAEQLPTMLQGMSVRSGGGGIPADVDAVANSTNITTGSMGTSQILSVIVDQAAFAAGIAATEQDDPEAVGGAQASMASENVGVGNESAVAVASRSIAQMQECGMDGIVPATDFAIPIGICSEKNDDAADCATVCPVGEFADLSNVENSGACTPCERGGFFADTEGRVGHGSHCACTMCKDGTWSAEVGADDPNEDCQVCPSGTQSDTPAGYRACPCLANFSRTDRFGECSTCEGVLGIKCEADARVLQQGFFWEFPSEEKEVEYLHFTANLGRSSDYDRALATFNGTYPPAYACPTPGNCLGVTENAASTCKDGTTGPLCAVCEETHFRLNGVCSACPQSKAGSVVSLIVIVLLFAIAIALVLRQNAKDIPLVDDWNPEKNESSEEAPNQVSASITVLGQQAPESAHKVEFMTLVKIVLGYTQIKALIQEVYPGVQWPTSYRSFTGGLQFMSSNPLSIVMPSCLSPSLTITSYGEFVIAALTPLVLAPIIWIYYKIKARNLSTISTASVPQAIKDGKRDPYTREDLKALCISTACFVYYLLYPTIAVASVRLLAACDSICRTGDGTDCINYLRADYSIQCDGQDSPRHNGYKVAAGFAFAVYSIILPAGIALLLRHGRQGSAKDLASSLMAGFSFYSKQYKPGYYFWETIDLYRKLFLTSMVVFIEDGTSMQVTFGIIFAVVGMSLQMIYNPYKYRDENRLALASQAITLLALLVGGLMRATQAEEDALMKYGNIDSVMTGAYLVTSGVLFYCLALVSFILYRYYKNNPADADTLGNGFGSASSIKHGSIELTVFSAAEAAQSSVHTEVDVGASKRNISNSTSQKEEMAGSSEDARFEGNRDATVDLKPTAVEGINSAGLRSAAINTVTSANRAGYLDVGGVAGNNGQQGSPRTAAEEASGQFDGFGDDSSTPRASSPAPIATQVLQTSKSAQAEENFGGFDDAAHNQLMLGDAGVGVEL